MKSCYEAISHLPPHPAGYSRIPLQLEKNHVVPKSSQDEALAQYGVSRAVPCSTLKCETVHDTLRATPQSSPTRRVPSRGTPRVPAPLPLSPFSPPDHDRRVDSPAWSGRGSWPSRRTQGQPKRKPEIPVVTPKSRRNSRKTMWFPPLGKMRPLPATASQGKSPVPP